MHIDTYQLNMYGATLIQKIFNIETTQRKSWKVAQDTTFTLSFH